MVTPTGKNKQSHKVVFVENAGTEITFYKTIGQDSANSRYFNLNPSGILKIEINPDAVVLLMSVDGDVFDYPQKIYADKQYTDRKMPSSWSKFVIRTVANNTKIQATTWSWG